MCRFIALLGLVLAVGLGPRTMAASWRYLLLSDSDLRDDCLICDRATIRQPMRGAFDLRLIDQNPLVSRYAVENLVFTAGDRPYRVTGSGTFEIGGEVAVIARMFLQ